MVRNMCYLFERLRFKKVQKLQSKVAYLPVMISLKRLKKNLAPPCYHNHTYCIKNLKKNKFPLHKIIFHNYQELPWPFPQAKSFL